MGILVIMHNSHREREREREKNNGIVGAQVQRLAAMKWNKRREASEKA